MGHLLFSWKSRQKTSKDTEYRSPNSMPSLRLCPSPSNRNRNHIVIFKLLESKAQGTSLLTSAASN